MTFTKEQLIAKAREQIAFCRHTKITGEGRTHVNQCSALFDIALAALTAPSEPVARRLRYKDGPWIFKQIGEDGPAEECYTEQMLYIAPPAPVVPAQSVYHDADCDSLRPRVVNGVFVPRDCNCRSAMLQGKE